MYERPKLKRFGSLRELTRAGWDGWNDGLFLQSVDGNLECSLGGSCS